MASESEERAAVVAEAMTWELTPYHHLGRLKGVGVDCAQFPLAVYAATGIIPPTEVDHYAQDFHMHKYEEIYLGWLRKFAHEIPEANLGPGDFGVWKFGRVFSHGAIMLEPPQIIHATINGRCVHRANYLIDDHLPTGVRGEAREVRFFSPWPRGA